MNNKYIRIAALLTAALALSWPRAGAQTDVEDSESDIRENPAIDVTAPVAAREEYPSYINLQANHIDLNGANWSRLAARLAAAADSAVAVVHIGDSHLQADIATAVTRRRLQQRYGNGGRGLIVPFKLAGTNEPRDYVLTSPAGLAASRLLKMPWPTEMTFTGIGIEPPSGSMELRMKGPDSFDRFTIHAAAPGVTVISLTDPFGWDVDFTAEADDKRLHVTPERELTEVIMQLDVPAGASIGAIDLRRGTGGLTYHVIGNNGATYSTYNLIGGMGSDVAALRPELIVISLGTNEAFGKVSDATFRINIDELVTDLRRANPGAELLLVTPAECQRRTVRRVRRKGRKGRRTVRSYAVNPNISRLRDVIVAYGRQNGIPVYDWYAVAGGAGSSARWLADKTLNTDRIHLTAAGYTLQGDLFTDALEETFHKSLSAHE